MNSRLLYLATVAISLLSTLATADESALIREQVKAEFSSAVADGTPQRTGCDDREQASRRASAHVAPSKFAQRVKAALSPA